MSPRVRFFLSIVLLMALPSLLVSGCAGGAAGGEETHELHMAPLEKMPQEVQRLPARIQEAYRYAVANYDFLSQIPCYCGCGPLGHKSLYDCYVDGVAADGTVIYDWHATGCTICVDITHDTVQMAREGKALSAIQRIIHIEYSRYGPPTVLE
ncbi:MAG: PCYCGC domain-containing protein [Chloroflexi bacterium]|nr:PCYCGC domain-containing protein [Chloroflexota bacterium]MCI0578494.1 PCYCGC domain-containing protein [Chloroflexota bacterium]MCI0648489.1 PCYCGC domain-containing protein [Chloroflexota bacterium]MCI0726013.1 PCYCGC domain-containing protein [Chloroflexota bacterium]